MFLLLFQELFNRYLFTTRSCLLDVSKLCFCFPTFQQGTTHTSVSSAGAAFEMRARWRATNASTPGRSPMNVTAVGRNSASSTSWKPTTVCTQVLWSKSTWQRRCLKRKTPHLLMFGNQRIGNCWVLKLFLDGLPDKVLLSVQMWWYQTWQPNPSPHFLWNNDHQVFFLHFYLCIQFKPTKIQTCWSISELYRGLPLLPAFMLS